MNSYQMVLHRPVETAGVLRKFESVAHAFVVDRESPTYQAGGEAICGLPLLLDCTADFGGRESQG
jgi:hypothetical protein